jgi:hypothetical protein
MVQSSYRLGLALEPLAELGFRDFDGDDAVQARVAGPVHFPHAARPDRRFNLIGTEPGAGMKGHALRIIPFRLVRRSPDLSRLEAILHVN